MEPIRLIYPVYTGVLMRPFPAEFQEMMINHQYLLLTF